VFKTLQVVACVWLLADHDGAGLHTSLQGLLQVVCMCPSVCIPAMGGGHIDLLHMSILILTWSSKMARKVLPIWRGMDFIFGFNTVLNPLCYLLALVLHMQFYA
jgi:hypothetical protein